MINLHGPRFKRCYRCQHNQNDTGLPFTFPAFLGKSNNKDVRLPALSLPLYTKGMSIDPTQIQGGQERLLSREISLKRGHPPTQVPGYEPERFLGAGAYGEVWVAIERNTGRRVAIKFYAHRGGLDWSLLSREVEKLAFLFADRYVVQLARRRLGCRAALLHHGVSGAGLAGRSDAKGPMPVDEAVELFRDMAVGSGPRPRQGRAALRPEAGQYPAGPGQQAAAGRFWSIAAFAEQTPALGTMFYMAPEQADLDAMPDARWDVYALGALLYCMLTGDPPHRTGRRWTSSSGRPI